MTGRHKLLVPLVFAIVLAGASLASAAGSANLAAGAGVEWHRICISHPEGYSYDFEFKVFPNGTAVGREVYPAPASGGSEYIYGAATRTGYAFASSYYDGFGGTEGFVLLINRDRTWCEYDFDDDEPGGEECGDWTFGSCQESTRRAAPWGRE